MFDRQQQLNSFILFFEGSLLTRKDVELDNWFSFLNKKVHKNFVLKNFFFDNVFDFLNFHDTNLVYSSYKEKFSPLNPLLKNRKSSYTFLDNFFFSCYKPFFDSFMFSKSENFTTNLFFNEALLLRKKEKNVDNLFDNIFNLHKMVKGRLARLATMEKFLMSSLKKYKVSDNVILDVYTQINKSLLYIAQIRNMLKMLLNYTRLDAIDFLVNKNQFSDVLINLAYLESLFYIQYFYIYRLKKGSIPSEINFVLDFDFENIDAVKIETETKRDYSFPLSILPKTIAQEKYLTSIISDYKTNIGDNLS